MRAGIDGWASGNAASLPCCGATRAYSASIERASPPAGFIGSHTCLVLLDHGHSVVIIDDLSNSFPRVFDHMKRIAGDKADRMRFVQVRRAAPRRRTRPAAAEHALACTRPGSGMSSSLSRRPPAARAAAWGARSRQKSHPVDASPMQRGGRRAHGVRYPTLPRGAYDRTAHNSMQGDVCDKVLLDKLFAEEK